MRCSVNRLLQLATKPRLQSMRSDTSSQVWPSARSKMRRARRASSARFVRLLARRVSSISSQFVNVIVSLMDTIIVYKWLLQSRFTDDVKGARAGQDHYGRQYHAGDRHLRLTGSCGTDGGCQP